MAKKYFSKQSVKSKAMDNMRGMILRGIDEALESGSLVAPWHKRISIDNECYSYEGKKYSFSNSLMLSMPGAYITFYKFSQLAKENPEIKMKKGSKSEKIYFYKNYKKEEEKKDKDGKIIIGKDGKPEMEVKKGFFLEEHSVFHESCFENLPPAKRFDAIEVKVGIEDLLGLLGVQKVFEATGDISSYDVKRKLILLEDEVEDHNLLHELFHILDKTQKHNDTMLSPENLKADIFAGLLMGNLGEDQEIQSSKEYLESWKKEIESDKFDSFDVIYNASKQYEKVKNLLIEYQAEKKIA